MEEGIATLEAKGAAHAGPPQPLPPHVATVGARGAGESRTGAHQSPAASFATAAVDVLAAILPLSLPPAPAAPPPPPPVVSIVSPRGRSMSAIVEASVAAEALSVPAAPPPPQRPRGPSFADVISSAVSALLPHGGRAHVAAPLAAPAGEAALPFAGNLAHARARLGRSFRAAAGGAASATSAAEAATADEAGCGNDGGGNLVVVSSSSVALDALAAGISTAAHAMRPAADITGVVSPVEARADVGTSPSRGGSVASPRPPAASSVPASVPASASPSVSIVTVRHQAAGGAGASATASAAVVVGAVGGPITSAAPVGPPIARGGAVAAERGGYVGGDAIGLPALGAHAVATAAAASARFAPPTAPLRPPGSAAELMFRRDGIWLRKQPLVAAMTVADVGVPARFLHPLPSDDLVVTLPSAGGGGGDGDGDGRLGRVAGSAVSDASGTDAGASGGGSAFPHGGADTAATAAAAAAARAPSPAAAAAATPPAPLRGLTLVRYAYAPFALPAALLGCIDDLTMPADMLTYVNAAVDAAVTEAAARAAAAGGASAAVSADDLVPLLAYVCSRSAWERPHACLSYCSNYGLPQGASSSGRDAYTLTLIQSCIAWICTRKQPRGGAGESGGGSGAGALARRRRGRTAEFADGGAAAPGDDARPLTGRAAHVRGDEATGAASAAPNRLPDPSDGGQEAPRDGAAAATSAAGPRLLDAAVARGGGREPGVATAPTLVLPEDGFSDGDGEDEDGDDDDDGDGDDEGDGEVGEDAADSGGGGGVSSRVARGRAEARGGGDDAASAPRAAADVGSGFGAPQRQRVMRVDAALARLRHTSVRMLPGGGGLLALHRSQSHPATDGDGGGEAGLSAAAGDADAGAPARASPPLRSRTPDAASATAHVAAAALADDGVDDADTDADADAYAELLGEDETAGAADDLAALKLFIASQDAIEGVLRVFG